MEQRTEEWYEARLGKVTASGVYNIIGTTAKGAPTQKYSDYRIKIITERLTKQPVLIPSTPAMQWGITHEADAIATYSFIYDTEVETCGFIDHPSIKNAGASPDGLINGDGLIEIKCPNSSTHTKFLLDDEIKPEYIAQMQFQMACTNRQWCDFVSFDPRFTGEAMHLSQKVKRVFRDDEYIAKMEEQITKFLAEIDEVLEKILTFEPLETESTPEITE